MDSVVLGDCSRSPCRGSADPDCAVGRRPNSLGCCWRLPSSPGSTVPLGLSPSVYEVDDTKEFVVQAHAEHAASFGLGLVPGSTNVDLSGFGEVEVKQGESLFSFTRAAHRELKFASKHELTTVFRTVLEEIHEREHPTTKTDLLDYAKAQLNDSDEEWLQFCRNSTKANDWNCPEQDATLPLYQRLLHYLSKALRALRRF